MCVGAHYRNVNRGVTLEDVRNLLSHIAHLMGLYRIIFYDELLSAGEQWKRGSCRIRDDKGGGRRLI